MSTVFVDPRVLAADGRAPASGSVRARDDAAALVRHLSDAGLRVVLVGDAESTAAAVAAVGLDPRDVAAAVPIAEGGWLVTTDPEACRAMRRGLRVRTVLVGAASPAGTLASRAADIVARDLVDAVLSILAAEAMPATP